MIELSHLSDRAIGSGIVHYLCIFFKFHLKTIKTFKSSILSKDSKLATSLSRPTGSSLIGFSVFSSSIGFSVTSNGVESTEDLGDSTRSSVGVSATTSIIKFEPVY